MAKEVIKTNIPVQVSVQSALDDSGQIPYKTVYSIIEQCLNKMSKLALQILLVISNKFMKCLQQQKMALKIFNLSFS